MTVLPLGKLPPDLLESILSKAPQFDPKIILGPGTGLDCAVVDNGDHYQVFKSDPITFTAENIGWYSVQINVNDIVTTGAIPKWMLSTLLLPENKTTAKNVEKITSQLYDAAKMYNISVLGGHTEVTHTLDRPILISTLIGEVKKESLITPQGAKTGDKILLTKGVPIEATAILAHDFEDQLTKFLSSELLDQAKDFLYKPGISIFADARIAAEHPGVTTMHDPTEGGIAAALWELSIASNKQLIIDPDQIFIPKVSKIICEYFNLNPLNTIASGALLLTINPLQAKSLIYKFQEKNIDCFEIGVVGENGQNVLIQPPNTKMILKRPERDDLAKVYENNN